MTSSVLDTLYDGDEPRHPKFKTRVIKVLAACAARGYVFKAYSGYRSPVEQATLWLRGRSEADRHASVMMLRNAGAPRLADILLNANRDTPVRTGRRVTNSLPGNSWHNFRLAVDCAWDKTPTVPGDNYEWNDMKGYGVYAEEAKKEELTAGLYWKNFVDAVHVQALDESSPLRHFKDWNTLETYLFMGEKS